MYKLLFKNLFISVLFVCISCQKQAEFNILSGQAFEDALSIAEKGQNTFATVLVESVRHNMADLLKNQL
jgi:hypothetical protein